LDFPLHILACERLPQPFDNFFVVKIHDKNSFIFYFV